MEKKDFSAGENKVNEYIARINNGEPREDILKDLPESFRKAIENGLDKKENVAEEKKDTVFDVPPQYEGLPSFVLEEIWTIPVYMDDKKTKFENERKRIVVENLRKKENDQDQLEENVVSDQERIEELRKKIQEPENVATHETNDDFESFSVSNGETDTGMFWYQYRNQAAKQLKSGGKFEWGKEIIYFDIKMEDMQKLSNLAMRIASENNIPIAYKFLDEEKTTQINKDGTETRFVANFSTEDDAKKFMLAIMNNEEYATFVSDRNLDYKGIRLDGIAQYASGFRETRGALERIMHGQINDDGTTYSYLAESGKIMTISKVEYEAFKKRYDETTAVMDKKRLEWDVVLKK